MDFTMDVDTEFVVTQSIRSTACGPLAKLKRKRSSEHLMLRHTLKRKVFVKDSQYTPNDAEICSSKVHDVNMNISDELSMMMASICLIEKADDQMSGMEICVLENNNDRFGVAAGNCDRIAHKIDGKWFDVDKSGVKIEINRNNDAHEQSAMNSSTCVNGLCGDFHNTCDSHNGNVSNDITPNSIPCSKFYGQTYGMISSTRSFLKDHLNANISYSYRTHFYLNR